MLIPNTIIAAVRISFGYEKVKRGKKLFRIWKENISIYKLTGLVIIVSKTHKEISFVKIEKFSRYCSYIETFKYGLLSQQARKSERNYVAGECEREA